MSSDLSKLMVVYGDVDCVDRKKNQMERDSSRPVVEKNLFHGTRKNVVDAICRYNFDWRLCGTHGTMYGHGK